MVKPIIVDMKKAITPYVVTNAEFSLVFYWLTGPIEIYNYYNERQFKQALEDFHLYEDPANSSGRIVWCSKPRLLERVRKNEREI